jgi:hypothetical protein
LQLAQRVLLQLAQPQQEKQPGLLQPALRVPEFEQLVLV